MHTSDENIGKENTKKVEFTNLRIKILKKVIKNPFGAYKGPNTGYHIKVSTTAKL